MLQTNNNIQAMRSNCLFTTSDQCARRQCLHIWKYHRSKRCTWSKWRSVISKWYSTHILYQWLMIVKHFRKGNNCFETVYYKKHHNSVATRSTIVFLSRASLQRGGEIRARNWQRVSHHRLGFWLWMLLLPLPISSHWVAHHRGWWYVMIALTVANLTSWPLLPPTRHLHSQPIPSYFLGLPKLQKLSCKWSKWQVQ